MVLCSSCDEDVELFHVCPAWCYTGPPETRNVGMCRDGTPVCDEGVIIECQGEWLPLDHEQCNNADDDCDGLVDEGVQNSPNAVDNFCNQCGNCSGTWERCRAGRWVCDYLDDANQPEECDGEDNDCDCDIDEHEDLYPNGEIVFCYSGPPGTAIHDPCRPGIETCERGHVVCDGEETPKEETCNGVDDNCNGLTDDASQYYDAVDVVLGIDTSGSMSGNIDAVTNVVCDYARATEGSETLYKFALVLIATPDAEFSLAQNLTDADVLCDVLDDISVQGGMEPTLSAAEAVVDPLNPMLIDWRENSKRIFIGFGDEPADVVYCNTLNVACSEGESVTNTLAYCTESNTDVYWFVNHTEYHDEQALGCGGDVFWLTPNEDYMLENLNSIVEEVCLEAASLP